MTVERNGHMNEKKRDMKNFERKSNHGLLIIGLTLAALVSAMPFQLSAGEQNQPFELHKPASTWPQGDYFIIKSSAGNLHLGPTGLWGEPFGQNIWVTKISVDSPADGKVLPNDVIYGVNGKDFPAKGDVRRLLSMAITEAETKEAGGKLTLHIRREGKLIRVPIRLKVMGSFSATTPWNCEKSKNIVADAEEFLRKGLRPETGLPNNEKYMYNTFHDSVLFIMASGNPKLQGFVRRHIHLALKKLEANEYGSKGWDLCYLAMLFGEYYHRTGDTTVLPHLKAILDRTEEAETKQGMVWSWPPKPSRYWLHPHMQIPHMMGQVLAQEAGLGTSKARLSFDLKYLNYKRAEHGYVKYCGYPSMPIENRQNQAPEGITEKQKIAGTYWNMNGKLGAAAALYNMVGGYEKTVEACALRCVYSFNITHKGHGGAWFNGFWTPIGALHAGQRKTQLFMKGQQWWRELYRDHTGSMWQTGHAKGKQDILSTGWAIHRVMHKKRLRMLGAPRSYFCPDPPPFMKPVLAAHRNRNYALAERLTLKLIANGKVPASAKERMNHFLESIQTLKKSIEYDLTFTETLLKKGNYSLAHVELPQLKMVVSPGNPRLKAIVKALESGKAKAHIASAIAKVQREQAAVPRRKDVLKKRREAFESHLASLVTLVKDGATYTGPRLGKGKLASYPKYKKNELSQWHLHETQSLENAPKEWGQPTFKPSKGWKTVSLPVKSRRKMGRTGAILFRANFEVKDVDAFKHLRIRIPGTRELRRPTIYLNGKIVAKGDIIPNGLDFNLKPSSLKLLRKGRNTLAISTLHGTSRYYLSLRLDGILKVPRTQKKKGK